MFKKFVREENLVGVSLVKSSVARGIRNTIAEQFPLLGDRLEEILPKKENISIGKCTDHLNLIVVNGEVVFFNERDGHYLPTLRLLHKYPDILPHVQVDRGAIKFVLSGAMIMCPGLTSPGARLPPDENELPAGTAVAVMAEGKQLALAVGFLKMSTREIREKNKDIGINNCHYLNDALWRMTEKL